MIIIILIFLLLCVVFTPIAIYQVLKGYSLNNKGLVRKGWLTIGAVVFGFLFYYYFLWPVLKDFLSLASA